VIPFLARRKYLFLLLLYPLVGMGFAYCEATVTVTRYVMEWPAVDRAIPFLPWMVWPYTFWYVLIAYAFTWTGWRDGPGFVRFSWYIYGGMASSYVIYLLFPNGEALRPALASLGQGWDFDLLRWLYTHDTPQNVNPSIHVIDTLGVWFALTRDRWWREHRGMRALLAVVCLAIIASTVTIKQHSVLDVLGGLTWSGLWWVLIYSRWSPFFRFSPH